MSGDENSVLESQWQELAGESSLIALRPILEGPDLEFIRELALLGDRFNSAHCLKSRDRYLKDQSTTSAQPERWAESRRALIAVIQPLLRQGIDPSLILLSLSHTQTHCIAISTIQDDSRVLGAGVDLEDSTRVISPRAAERFIRPTETALGLTPLQAWTLKEACYKADPDNLNTLIPHYEVISLDGAAAQVRSDRNPGMVFKTKLIEHSGQLVALAVSGFGGS